MKIRRSGSRSDDVVDRRGQGGGPGVPLSLGAGGGIIGVIIALVALFMGGGLGGGGDEGGFDITDIFGRLQAPPPATSNRIDAAPDPDAELVDFVSFVISDVNDQWEIIFRNAGLEYTRAKLVLFDGGVQTGCGGASSAVGPFYCPPDQSAYLDLSFFRELASRFDAPGDFAQAYVIAHEVGHHIQNLTGVNEEVRRLQQRRPREANELSVRQELQADCFAGVWAYTTYERGLLEEGDIEEGLEAAAAVGDDRLQRQAGQRVDPESFTHGTSKQRQEWFMRGYRSGDPADCDTFSGDI